MTITTIHTLGHGSRDLEGFLALLTETKIGLLADVRAYPRSRRHPHFNGEALARALNAHGIDYLWLGRELGGMRKAQSSSPHLALDPGMHGYADHMQSQTFRHAIERMLHAAADTRIALMCAERLPEHCHRSFIADALSVLGANIAHLIDVGETHRHTLNTALRIENGTLIYDRGAQGTLL